jgi:hypothetical protein
MFSFFSNKSPGGSNLAANGSSASSREGEETKSSFSFMSGAAPADQETIPQESSSSGFGFMSSTGTFEAVTEDTSGVSSGFSFLQGASASETNDDSVSSFSFMSQPAQTDVQLKSTTLNSPPQKDLMSMEVHVPQDVKLAKAASTKVVKKKKKATRVGFGRDDDEDDTPAPSATATSQALGPAETPFSIADPAVVASTTGSTATIAESLDEAADDGNLPPAPPPYRPTTPPARESVSSEANAEQATILSTPMEEPSASMFSGFSFVNNNSPSVEQTSSSNDEVNVPPAPTSSGFGFLSTMDTEASHSSQPLFIPDTMSATTGNDDQSFGVPDHILKSLDGESRKLGRSIQGFVELYNSAYDMFTKLMTDVVAVSQSCIQLTDKIQQLEQQQNILAECEEFEQAAIISAEIETIQSALIQMAMEKDRTLETLTRVKQEYDQTRPSVTAAFSNSFDSVFAFVAAAKEADEQGRKKLNDFVQEENDRLSVEEQRIQMEKSHCEREQATLQSESAVVEEAINTQVGDQLEKKKDLEIQSFAVQEEIRRLEEQLALKRAEEVDINKQIKQIDTKILEVRKKYERQLARIAERRETLSKAQSECAYEDSIVAENRNKMDSIVSSALESYRILSIQAETKQQEVILAETFMKDVQLSVEDDDHSFSLDYSWYITESEEIYRCFSSGDHLSSSSKDLIDRVSSLENSIHLFEKQAEEYRTLKEVAQTRWKSLVETIDRLEVEKKSYATNKRFKEAASTAKELKEAGEAKDQVELEVKNKQAELDNVEETRQKYVFELEEVRHKLREEQKFEKLIHYNCIRRRTRNSERIKRKVSKVQALYPSDFTRTLLELYERETDRLQQIRRVLVRECEIDEASESIDEEEVEEDVVMNSDVLDGAEYTKECADAIEANENTPEEGMLSALPVENSSDVTESESPLGDTEAYDVNADDVDLLPAVISAECVLEEEQVPAVPEIDREVKNIRTLVF